MHTFSYIALIGSISIIGLCSGTETIKIEQYFTDLQNINPPGVGGWTLTKITSFESKNKGGVHDYRDMTEGGKWIATWSASRTPQVDLWEKAFPRDGVRITQGLLEMEVATADLKRYIEAYKGDDAQQEIRGLWGQDMGVPRHFVSPGTWASPFQGIRALSDPGFPNVTCSQPPNLMEYKYPSSPHTHPDIIPAFERPSGEQGNWPAALDRDPGGPCFPGPSNKFIIATGCLTPEHFKDIFNRMLRERENAKVKQGTTHFFEMEYLKCVPVGPAEDLSKVYGQLATTADGVRIACVTGIVPMTCMVAQPAETINLGSEWGPLVDSADTGGGNTRPRKKQKLDPSL